MNNVSEPCWNCGGRESTVKQKDCEYCGGKGMTLTVDGSALLAALKDPLILEPLLEILKERLDHTHEFGRSDDWGNRDKTNTPNYSNE